MIKKGLKIILPLILVISFHPVALAAVSQEGWNPESLKSTNLPDRKVDEILLTFIDWALIIIGLLGVIVFIYGGFIYLTAQGETTALERAKKIIIYAVVGIAVAVLGYVAVQTIDDILKGKTGSGGGGSPSNSAPANYAIPPTGSSAPPSGGSTPSPSAGSEAPLPVAPGMVN